jgi:hypothetical protein
MKPIKILKKTTGLIRFRFYKQKTEKTEPNRNRKNGKKPSQTEKPSQTGFLPKKPNRTETGSKPVGLTRFRFGFGFFFRKKISVWLFFLIKTEPNRK